MIFFKKSSLGFTVVEMLVVISVIAILSAIAYANFGQVRAVARDSIRKTDLQNLKVAIELYKKQYGEYPASCNGGDSWGGNEPPPSGAGFDYSCPAGTPFIVGLSPEFIATLPSEPDFTATNKNYLYRTNASQTEYKVLSRNVESQFIESYNDEFARCTADGISSNLSCQGGDPRPGEYAVYSSGADGW